MSCNCNDLIGRPYRIGANGSGAEIDCIHLVYEVLRRLDIATPPLDPAWYEGGSGRTIARALLDWGKRVDKPSYDGDVLLIRQPGWAFAVTWQTGILYINRNLNKVAWSPSAMFHGHHCFRSRSN
jgi:hypothetical protein